MDVSSAAGFTFLVTLSVGALFLVTLKLQAPSLGAGASPLAVVSGIVILGLACLGVPTQVGDVTVSVVPLGALLAIGAATVWSAARTIRRIDAPTMRERVLWGAAVSLPFGLLCGVAAAVFRIRGSGDAVAATPLWGLGLGLFWGAAFGAVGGWATGGLLDAARAAAQRLRARRPLLHAGLHSGGVMAVIGFVLAAAASLVWLVILLARSPRGDFGAGDALAGVIQLALFAPNVIVWTLAVALGGSIDLAAGLAGPTRGADFKQSISLWGWPGGTPWYAYVLLAIPALATIWGGMAAARAGSQARVVLGLAATGMAAMVLVLAWLSAARVAPGLLRPRAFAYVAPEPLSAAGLTLLWAAGGGTAGLALSRPRRTVP